MTHIDEHTLDLYVLHAEEVESKRSQIDKHLAECYGCRAIVGELTEFYAGLEKDLEEMPGELPSPETAILRSRRGIEPYFNSDLPPIPYRPTRPIEKFQYFVRNHPIVTGVGSFAMVAGLAAALVLTSRISTKDDNPSYEKDNITSDFIEVYNKHDEKLWQLPSINLKDNQVRAMDSRNERAIITDFDGNGKNELVTTLPIISKKEKAFSSLRVYDYDKNIRWERNFEEPVNYLDRKYSPYFNPSDIIVDDFGGASGKEILVSICHRGRSPFFLARLDKTSEVIGEYWHFGQMDFIYEVRIGPEKKKAIIACGINDVDDTNRGEFGAVAVLDPQKINGQKKSSATPGFQMPVSDAELYYIKIPESDMSKLLHKSNTVVRMEREDSTMVSFTAGFRDSSGILFNFDYIFSLDSMKILRIKSNNNIDRFHDLLVKEGKLTGKLDQSYLDALKDDVRYWDGRDWKKQVTMVQSPFGQ